MKSNTAKLAVCGCAATSTFAQSIFGSFVGTVQDQSGSSIVGAEVALTDLDDNNVRTAATSASGGTLKMAGTAWGNYLYG